MLIPFELSIEDSKYAAYHYDTAQAEDLFSADPFDIVAALEEELGEPLCRS